MCEEKVFSYQGLEIIDFIEDLNCFLKDKSYKTEYDNIIANALIKIENPMINVGYKTGRFASLICKNE